MREFDCAGHLGQHGGYRAGAAHGVDQVVVGQLVARGQQDPPGTGVDVLGVVDHQPDAVPEQCAVIDGRGMGVSDQLVQADSLDEDGARVYQGDVDIWVLSQMIGGQGSGVSTADYDHAGFLVGLLGHLGHCFLLFSRDLCL